MHRNIVRNMVEILFSDGEKCQRGWYNIGISRKFVFFLYG